MIISLIIFYASLTAGAVIRDDEIDESQDLLNEEAEFIKVEVAEEELSRSIRDLLYWNRMLNSLKGKYRTFTPSQLIQTLAQFQIIY